MGRVMAIDWGERRVGIALSDETRTIASPHSVIKRSGSLDRVLEEISGLAANQGGVLMGGPSGDLHMLLIQSSTPDILCLLL